MIERIIKRFGDSAHIILPKRLVGKTAKVYVDEEEKKIEFIS